MKLFASVSLMALSCSGYARNYGKAGCGLGSELIRKEGSQVAASFINLTLYTNQPFAITSGTSNCVPDATTAALLKQESFVANNYANLSKEMAQGQGESLHALAQVLGCEAKSHPEFSRYTQSKFATIYQAPGSIAMLDRVKTEIAKHPSLASSCTLSQIY